MSAHRVLVVGDDGVSAGADAFLAKPVGLDDLLARSDALLRGA
jgi:DNA-binding response OmpR family regulator